MKLGRFLFLVIFLILSEVAWHPSFSEKVKSKYFQFSNQLKPLLQKATNFAILKSKDLSQLPSSKFTICGSIYIGYYRGYQAFYTVRRNDHATLWFSLGINNQDTKEEVYSPVLFYFGGDVISNTGNKLRLRPHAWSHACTTLDVESGYVTVVINGILTHNTTISSLGLAGNVPTIFQKNLVLGVLQFKFHAATFRGISDQHRCVFCSSECVSNGR